MPTPNLYLVTQKLLRPHRWFTSNSSSRAKILTEHRYHPIPGTYEYRPGRGWSLIATDEIKEKLTVPVRIKYSRVLRRDLLQPDYDSRKSQQKVKAEDGNVKELGFFRLDDGIAWVNYLDEEGNFIHGPYKMWCVDKSTGDFRPMLKGDDPAWHSRHSSRRTSTTNKSDENSQKGDSSASSKRADSSIPA